MRLQLGRRRFVQPGSTCSNRPVPSTRKNHHEHAPTGFDSHFSSCGKVYHYLLDGAAAPHPGDAKARWWVYDRWCEQSRGKPQKVADVALNVEAMQEAAQLLQVRVRAVWVVWV